MCAKITEQTADEREKKEKEKKGKEKKQPTKGEMGQAIRQKCNMLIFHSKRPAYFKGMLSMIINCSNIKIFSVYDLSISTQFLCIHNQISAKELIPFFRVRHS